MLFVLHMVIAILLDRYMADSELRIIGGTDAPPEKYDYIVRIEVQITIYHHLSYNHVCTGTALTPLWTLTAGHCISSLQQFIWMKQDMFESVKGIIRYGSASAAAPTDSDLFSDIVDLLLHPSFKIVDLQFSVRVRNDIGLIKNTPVKLKLYGKLCAADYKTLSGQVVAAVSYGRMFDGQNISSTLVMKKPLQVLDVVLYNCPANSDRTGVIYPSICIAKKCGNLAILCPGDSGAPFIHPAGVAALVTVGNQIFCTRKHIKAGPRTNYVGMATPVSPYLNWIRKQIETDTAENH